MKNTLTETAKKIKIIDKFDVIVVGGGIAGSAAAIAASRNNSKVCIIEKEYSLGGLATLGLVWCYLPLCDGKGHQVIGGLGEELLKNSIKYGPGEIPECWRKESSIKERAKNRYELIFNPASYMLSLEELVIENNITVFYDTRFCDVVLKNNKIQAILVENKSGRCAIQCKNIIDASGDADVCFKAGEDTIYFNTNRRACWYFSYDNLKLKINEFGDPLYKKLEANVKTFSGIDHKEVSEFIIQSRRMLADKIQKLRKKNKALYPVLIPTMPMFRMTRRLKGSFELDEKDEGKYFLDSVGMIGDWRKPGPVYYIPFKSLICKKVKNLITAGRCISVTNSTWDITRVIPVCAVTGEAAGTAAALSSNNKKDFCDLNIVKLQNQLMKQGVLLNRTF
ncbi:MAG: FAD-dependent oxidoreductase [Actinobacteria bacterium]|nr:FAD-dependent oxidoreductase [Actinomycetota bacterium]